MQIFITLAKICVMKKLLYFFGFVPILLIASGCFYSTGNDDDFLQNSPYSPVIFTRAELESSVQIQPQQNIIRSGKIYIKDNLMFINDVNKGFHVFNYADPQNPIKIAFIQVPGATDLAVRDNIIYINQAVDLVTIAYDPASNTIGSIHRARNVFPAKLSPFGDTANINPDQIVIDWIPN